MEKINIRNYVPEDISQVIEVQKEYKRKYPNYSIRGAEVYTHHPVFENGKNILCAFDNKDSLIAYWFNDVDGITEEVFVLPQWRREGIAQGVIREALVYLKECGKLNAELEVKKSNGKARALYEKMGYEIYKEERSLGIFI